MNVLIVTGIFPPDIGGPATYVPQVSAALSELIASPLERERFANGAKRTVEKLSYPNMILEIERVLLATIKRNRSLRS